MYCTPVTSLFIALLVLVAACFLCLTVYALYIFIKETKEKRSKLNKTFEIIFFVSTITCTIFIILLVFGSCEGMYSETTFIDLHLYCGGFFLIQGFMTLILFYTKLLRIFDGTVYSISKITKFIYNSVFTLLGIVQFIWLVLTFIAFAGYDLGSLIYLIILSLLVTMILNISMTIMFSFKLAKTIEGVRRNAEVSIDSDSDGASGGNDTQQPDILLGAISKLTTLVSISLVMTFTDYVWQNVADQPSLKTNTTWIVVVYIWFADLVTNFLCIALCYGSFKKYYFKFCGCCDGCCRVFASNVCQSCAKGGKSAHIARVGSDADIGSNSAADPVSIDSDNTAQTTTVTT
eukprot:251241_1